MKVCTDACLFGAWTAAHIAHRKPEEISISFKEVVLEKASIQDLQELQLQQETKILDIGGGTGLLSLMLAQQLKGTIDVIEINESASLQAKENVDRSKWKDRINVIQADVMQYFFKNKYDLIISNPPFYENDLRTMSIESNMARHDETLRLEGLISIAYRQLSSSGVFAVLIPYHRSVYCIDIAAKYNLFPFKMAGVKQSVNHNFFRRMIVFKKNISMDVMKEELAIKEGDNYTPEFRSLLKDYYLHL